MRVRKAGTGQEMKVPLPLLAPNWGWRYGKMQTRQRAVLRPPIPGWESGPLKL